MYIIVVGGGNVGYHLSKALIDEGHEVLILEKDGRKVNQISDELGSMITRGDGCEAATFAEIGAGRADVLIAVTGDDEDNLVSCQVAKFRFSVPRTIAIINNPKNEQLFLQLGIDSTVSSTNVILEHIGHEVPQHPMFRLLELKRFGLEIVDLTVRAGSAVIGKRLNQLALPSDTTISLVISPTVGPQVAQPDLVLGQNDEVIAVTRDQHERQLRALFGN